MTFGSDSETAIAPIAGEASFCLSKIRFQGRPPFFLLQTPPPTGAKIVDILLSHHTRYCDHAPAAKRADQSILQALPRSLVFTLISIFVCLRPGRRCHPSSPRLLPRIGLLWRQMFLREC